MRKQKRFENRHQILHEIDAAIEIRKRLIESSDGISEVECILAMALSFIMEHVQEVKNEIGGVIGYKLNLTVEQTAYLWRLMESRHNP